MDEENYVDADLKCEGFYIELMHFQSALVSRFRGTPKYVGLAARLGCEIRSSS